jgi:isoleucyl-tRNA synthetase
MFRKVNPKQNFVELEHKILDFWDKNKILEKYLQKNKNAQKRWSFLDGPITANNPMGVHHAWGRTLKDLWQRFYTMRGFDQRYQNGFDCQGLWVEVEVEKELGFKNKKDIEKYGIDKFVEKCKERVRKYSKIQTNQSIRLAEWMDWNNSYYTMSDENNYTIWHFLKVCHENSWVYKGTDSVPWCPRCGTAISQHEILTEEYKKITHDSVFFVLPITTKGWEDHALLVWTTTPWTIPANIAVAADPKKEYVMTSDNYGRKLILVKSRAEKILSKEFKIAKTFLGKEIIGLNYKAPFDDIEGLKKQKGNYKHKVVESDNLILPVSEEEGTGLVHVATGAGSEDFQLGKKYNLPVVSTIEENADYGNHMGYLAGHNAKKHPEIIFEHLKKKENGAYLLKIEPYTHRYPTCWRCKEELVWRNVSEWYIAMDKKEIPNPKSQTPKLSRKTFREKMIGVAKKIKWIPSWGMERELDWLNNMHDWLISKKRYWGLALPIFECECGHFEVIGSKEELKKRAVAGWDQFENHSPHRPWVDNVQIKCPKCGKNVSRIHDVGNPWLDAGIVPFSTYIDPETKKVSYLSDKKYWKKWFPADFITECFPGQFKNWFYSLIAMSAALEDTNPFKVLLGHASVRDEKGEEMHKSKGNAIWFDEAAEKMGTDVMRWMYCSQNPINNLLFGYKVAEQVKRKLILLLNVYSFFITYAIIDKFTPSKNKKPSQVKNLLDKWIISELNQLILKAEERLGNYDSMTFMKLAENFLNNLANWYVRRSRRRFWKSESDEDKKAAYETLYEVLIKFTQVLAPAIPFLTEGIYQNLSQNSIRQLVDKTQNYNSVHLCDWPQVDKKLIDNKLNNEMDLIRKIATLGLAARAKAKIKVRQPLGKFKIQSLSRALPTGRQAKSRDSKFKIEEKLIDLLKDEINVKEVEFVNKIDFEVEEREDKKIYHSKEAGFEVEGGFDLIVALEIKLTPKLQHEGYAREIVRHIQALRKQADYNVDDRIKVYYELAKHEIKETFENFADYIKKETLAQSLAEKKSEDVDIKKEVRINDAQLWIGLKKV